MGRFGFRLEVDGKILEPTYERISYTTDPIKGVLYVAVYNFPDGMDGTHIFTGHWMINCKDAVENFGYDGECKNPAELVDIFVKDVTVEFVAP